MALFSLNIRLYLNQQGYVHWLYNKVESYDIKRRKFFTNTIKQTESKSIVSSHLSMDIVTTDVYLKTEHLAKNL